MTDLNSIINQFIKEDRFQRLIQLDEFYLEKCRILFQEFKYYDISNFRKELIDFSKNISKPFKYITLLENEKDQSIKELLYLIGRLITYFDTKGWNIREWNEYDDKRVISKANLSQYRWLVNFISFKLNECIRWHTR
ncbi:MAG: hypothetical protein IPG85_09565 [Bacteroidetes bacterium]|nr:hypothetical protein [Bacteroidota bacterium]